MTIYLDWNGRTPTQAPDDDGVYPCELGPETLGCVTKCAALCGVCFAAARAWQESWGKSEIMDLDGTLIFSLHLRYC